MNFLSPLDQTGITLPEYLEHRGVEFVNHLKDADIVVRKADRSLNHPSSLEAERLIQENLRGIPNLVLIDEPRELAPAAYRLADPERTLAAAPGQDFNRLVLGQSWLDPQTENWNQRLDRICWIAPPTSERLVLVRRLLEIGVEVDIYSHQSWNIKGWKGSAENVLDTARKYKYQIISENSLNHLYHSEKLFRGFKSGCVCFYWADPNLYFPFLQGTYLPFDLENVKHRRDLSAVTLANMNSFMQTAAWEVYSPRTFLDNVFILAQSLGTSFHSVQNMSREARL